MALISYAQGDLLKSKLDGSWHIVEHIDDSTVRLINPLQPSDQRVLPVNDANFDYIIARRSRAGDTIESMKSFIETATSEAFGGDPTKIQRIRSNSSIRTLADISVMFKSKEINKNLTPERYDLESIVNAYFNYDKELSTKFEMPDASDFKAMFGDEWSDEFIDEVVKKLQDTAHRKPFKKGGQAFEEIQRASLKDYIQAEFKFSNKKLLHKRDYSLIESAVFGNISDKNVYETRFFQNLKSYLGTNQVGTSSVERIIQTLRPNSRAFFTEDIVAGLIKKVDKDRVSLYNIANGSENSPITHAARILVDAVSGGNGNKNFGLSTSALLKSYSKRISPESNEGPYSQYSANYEIGLRTKVNDFSSIPPPISKYMQSSRDYDHKTLSGIISKMESEGDTGAIIDMPTFFGVLDKVKNLKWKGKNNRAITNSSMRAQILKVANGRNHVILSKKSLESLLSGLNPKQVSAPDAKPVELDDILTDIASNTSSFETADRGGGTNASRISIDTNLGFKYDENFGTLTHGSPEPSYVTFKSTPNTLFSPSVSLSRDNTELIGFSTNKGDTILFRNSEEAKSALEKEQGYNGDSTGLFSMTVKSAQALDEIEKLNQNTSANGYIKILSSDIDTISKLQDNGSIIDTTEQKLMDSQNLGELHREIASKTADAKIIDLASIKKQKLDVTIQKTAAEIQQSRMRRIAHFQASRVGYMIRRNGEKVMLASDIPLQPQIDRIRRMTAQGNSRTFYLDIETNPHAAAGFQLQEYGSKSGTNAAREFQVIENLSKKDDLTYRRGRTITLLHNIAKDIKNHDFVVTQGNYDLRTLQAETQAHIDYFKHQISGTFSDRELAHFGREAVVELRKNRKFFDKEGNKLPGVLDHHVTAERLRLIEEKKKLVLDTRANNKEQSEQFIKVLESIQEQFRSAEDHKIIQSDFMYALAGMGESGRVSQSAMAPKFGFGTNRHSASTDVGQMFDLTELAQRGQFQDELQHNINSQGIIKSLAPNENLTDGQIRLITAPGDRSFGTIKESFYYEKENVRMEKDLSLGRDIVELQRGYRLSKGTDGVYRALPSMWVNENNSAFSPSLAANRFNYESIEANYNNLNGLSPETANGFGTGKWVEDLNHDYMLRAIGDTNPSLNRTFRTDSLVGDSMTHESKNGSYFSKKVLAERAAIPHFDSLREELSQLADKAFLEMKEEMGGQGEFAHASLLDLMKHRALLVGMDEHSREADKLRYHYIPTMLSIGQKFLDQADELISNRALEVMKATNSNSDPFGFAILKDVFGKALLGQDDRYTALLETHNTYSDKIVHGAFGDVLAEIQQRLNNKEITGMHAEALISAFSSNFRAAAAMNKDNFSDTTSTRKPQLSLNLYGSNQTNLTLQSDIIDAYNKTVVRNLGDGTFIRTDPTGAVSQLDTELKRAGLSGKDSFLMNLGQGIRLDTERGKAQQIIDNQLHNLSINALYKLHSDHSEAANAYLERLGGMQADAVRDLLSHSLGLEGENIGDREAYISKLKGMRFIEDPNSMVAKVLNGIKNDENIVLGIQNQAAKNYAAIVERNPNLTQAEHDEYAKAFVQVKNIVENHMNSPEETAQKFYDTFGKISALSQDPNSKVGDLFTNQSLEFKPDFITDSEVHQSYQRAQHQINVLMGHEDISPGINIGNIVENPAALTQLVLESKRAIEQIPSEDPQHKLRAGSAFLDHIISTLHQVSDPNVNIEDMLSRLVSSDIPIFANPSQSIYNDLVDRIPGVKRGASPPAPHSVNPGGPIGPTNTQQFASLVNQVVGEVNGNATNTAGSTVGQIHATNLGALAPGSASALQGKLEVPIMAIGGIMALVGASQGWEPWLGQWSQGNVSDTIMPTTQNRALAKVSEIPGNPDTASTWSGDLAPFHINISFRGFVKNREDTDRLRSMVYDSVNSEMTVTATNDNVSERRDSSVHMMAHEFLQNAI